MFAFSICKVDTFQKENGRERFAYVPKTLNSGILCFKLGKYAEMGRIIIFTHILIKEWLRGNLEAHSFVSFGKHH